MYSYDVFDTVITRNTARPGGIFALVECELLKNSLYSAIPVRYRENFFTLRRNAERLAARIYKQAKSIDTIYKVLGMNGDVSTEQLELIKKLEIETEYINSVPIDENIEKIRLLLQNGEKVIFISDMYLSSEDIRRLICKHAPDFKNIPIYVSCEHECDKSSGELFKKVKESENIEFNEWIHVGDNLRADIDGARKNGITALKYDYPALHQFEKKLLKYYENDASVQITIGIARNVRMNKGIADGEFNNEFVYGCSYGAPMIYSYVAWILKQCAEKGIKRLYFVSRDGYIPKIIADYLIERYGFDIQTKYIYGSRKAWLAAFNKELDLPHFCTKLLSITNFFDVTVEDIKAYFPDIDAEAFLTIEQLEEINKNTDFKEYLTETQKDNRIMLLKEYLLQELDISDDNFAFVEINGTGRSLSTAVSLLKPFYQGIFRSFWATDVNITELHNFNMYTYQYHTKSRLYLENICRAPHGLVTGYEIKNERIVPVFGGEDYSEILDFDAYIDGVRCFTAKYADIYGVNDNVNVYAKWYNIALWREDREVINFHSKFVYDQMELGNIYRVGENIFVNDVIFRLNTKFNGLKIAVYGAGKLGREFRLKLGDKCAAWFDSAYEKYLSQGYNVHNPHEINVNSDCAFDVIIIAVGTKNIFCEIKDFLISIGVSKEKIFWLKGM